LLEEFRKISYFHVAFGDVDMLRHVNNVTYARWSETARCEYFAEVLDLEPVTSNPGLILAKLEIIFEGQLAYRERVALGCRVRRIGTKSFEFAQEVWSADRGLRGARISAVVVAMDYFNDRTVEVPESWRKRIEAFESTPATT